MKHIVVAIIRFYQVAISGSLGPHCRFYPSCSAYALEAVRRFGCLRGCWLGMKRVLKCHPCHPGGVDPVPKEQAD